MQGMHRVYSKLLQVYLNALLPMHRRRATLSNSYALGTVSKLPHEEKIPLSQNV